MAKVKIQGHASGTGILTVTAPNTSTDRTITLPDSTGTLATTADVPAGISSSADATAITIGSDESVGIDNSTGFGTYSGTGVKYSKGDGTFFVGRDGGQPLWLNRETSQGDLIGLAAAGSTYARIGTTSNALVFKTGTGGNTERMRILADGGLTFNGDTAAANALDDYEEGTWTPTLSGTTGGPSGVNFDFRTGWYTKIGRQVTAAWIIGMSSWSSGPSGNALISGLPFNAMTDTNFNMSPVIGYSSRFNTDNAPRGGFIESNTSVVRLLRSADTSSRNNVNTNVTCSGLGGDEYIYGQITYFTA